MGISREKELNMQKQNLLNSTGVQNAEESKSDRLTMAATIADYEERGSNRPPFSSPLSFTGKPNTEAPKAATVRIRLIGSDLRGQPATVLDRCG